MTSTFRSRLASIAEDQHDRFHLVHETDEPLRGQIEQYWTETGISRQGAEPASWSAAFVSWCVTSAGASAAEFAPSPLHSTSVHRAIANAAAGTGDFRAYEISEAAPEVGDMIQSNRGGNCFDFAHAAAHDSYPSHVAIVVETGIDARGHFAITIGGKGSDSIRRKRVPLTEKGLVEQREQDPFISVIKVLK